MANRARLFDLGRRRYAPVLELQRALHAAVAEGREPDTWLVVEHEPVITLGRNAKEANVLLSRQALAARGVDCVEIERGGDVTYHGPGQVVVYPIRRLERFREVVPLVTALESAVCGALYRFGIEAQPRSEHRGVYVGDDAICAIGLAVKRMVSLHGLALNACTALDYDRLSRRAGRRSSGSPRSPRSSAGTSASTRRATSLLDALEGGFGLEFERATIAAGSAPFRFRRTRAVSA